MQAGAVRCLSFDRYDSDAVQFDLLMIHALSLSIAVMTILRLYAPLISSEVPIPVSEEARLYLMDTAPAVRILRPVLHSPIVRVE